MGSLPPSPEAQAARATFGALRDQLAEVLSGCGSGEELIRRGFPEDVALAADLGASRCVPVLRGGAFVDAAS